MHVLFCSTVFFIGLPWDSTRTIIGLVKVLCLIPSCIATLVTSAVLKFCNSRACPWLVRISKFPMALENKRFGFAFDRSSSPSSTQPSDYGRQSSPHLTSELVDWDKSALLDLKSASRTRPNVTFGTEKSAG